MYKRQVQQQSQSIDGLYGQYTLKVDVNGRIAGFGLASTNVASAFSINADRFYITSSQDPTAGDLGFVYNAGTAPDPETGVVMPKGLYLKAAFIKEASITTAKIRGQAVSIVSSVSHIVNTGETPIFSYTTPSNYLNSGGNQVLVRANLFSFDTKGSMKIEFLRDGAVMAWFPFRKNGWGMGSLTETIEVLINGSFSNSAYSVRITSQGDGFVLSYLNFTATVNKR